jgi:hypothetical protein
MIKKINHQHFKNVQASLQHTLLCVERQDLYLQKVTKQSIAHLYSVETLGLGGPYADGPWILKKQTKLVSEGNYRHGVNES